MRGITLTALFNLEGVARLGLANATIFTDTQEPLDWISAERDPSWTESWLTDGAKNSADTWLAKLIPHRCFLTNTSDFSSSKTTISSVAAQWLPNVFFKSPLCDGLKRQHYNLNSTEKAVFFFFSCKLAWFLQFSPLIHVKRAHIAPTPNDFLFTLVVS